MPLAAAILGALSTPGTRTYSLTIGGNDVVLAPTGTAGVRLGTPIESIELIERGPGSISELNFSVDDPLGILALSRGLPVRFRDLTNDVMRFAGFLNTWAPAPWAPTGRTIAIRCQGIEAVLDWAKVKALTIPAATPVQDAIQMAVAAVATGLAAPLRAIASTQEQGTAAQPIGHLYSAVIDLTTALTVPEGSTLREAIRAICDDAVSPVPGVPLLGTGVNLCTVDFDLGLRVYPDLRFSDQTLLQPQDWAKLTVNNAIGSAAAASDLMLSTDGMGSPVAVLVQGATASLVVTDGTGEAGETALLNDPSLNTTTRMLAAGAAYLAQFAEQARGSFGLEAINTATTGANVHAGGIVSLTDAQLGLAAAEYRLSEIAWRFYGGAIDWRVTFGGAAPSMAALARNLTRATLA